MLCNNLSTELSNSVELLLLVSENLLIKVNIGKRKSYIFGANCTKNVAFNLCYRDEKDFFDILRIIALKLKNIEYGILKKLHLQTLGFEFE